METVHFRTMESPRGGPLTLAGSGGRLRHLRMVDQTYEPSRDGWEADDTQFDDAVAQLQAYFAGDLLDFDVELDLVGTEFQRRVWAALLRIPYGGNAVLRSDRVRHWFAWCVACGRVGEWPQSDRHHRAMPSRDRCEWKLDGIRRRTAEEEAITGNGT